MSNNIEEILKLLNALTELPFETMEVSTQELTVKVSRGGAGAAPAVASVVQRPVSLPQTAPAAPAPQDSKRVNVTSPIIGMFYASPSPEEAPFVAVGEHVTAGQTLCIVEAMKLMNEIPSPVSGTVVQVLAADGGEVEVGQALFVVEASED